MALTIHVFDDDNIKRLPVEERFERCSHTIKNDPDESKRWDATWLAGEIAEGRTEGDRIFNQVADLMGWILVNDNNNVVKHEACYQIAARNMRSKIPDLINAALNDKSGLTKHEALESLGLMRATETINLIDDALSDPSEDVRQTAEFVIKRLKRMQCAGNYKPSTII